MLVFFVAQMSQTAETPRSSRLHLDNVMIDRAEETSLQRGKVEAYTVHPSTQSTFIWFLIWMNHWKKQQESCYIDIYQPYVPKLKKNICSFAPLFGWITKNQKIIILPCRNSALKFRFEIDFDSNKKNLLSGCCSEQGPGKVSSIANLTEHDLAAGSVSLWVVRNCGLWSF